MTESTQTAPQAFTLASLTAFLSDTGGAFAACARQALASAGEGAAVAIGLTGTIRERMRDYRREQARSEVSRRIVDDAQRFFERSVMARSEGREWLVTRPGQGDIESMDDERFAQFRQSIAAAGGTLVTVQFQGSTARDMKATLTRYVGGMLEGTMEDMPAVVRATVQGIERAYFQAGHKLEGPLPYPDVGTGVGRVR